MTLSPGNDKEEKLKDLLDYNAMKTDKHMRDAEAFLNSRYYEPAEKRINTMTMRSKFNTDKRPYKAKTKLDIDKEFLLSGEGNVSDAFKEQLDNYGDNCDAHYKYGL